MKRRSTPKRLRDIILVDRDGDQWAYSTATDTWHIDFAGTVPESARSLQRLVDFAGTVPESARSLQRLVARYGPMTDTLGTLVTL